MELEEIDDIGIRRRVIPTPTDDTQIHVSELPPSDQDLIQRTMLQTSNIVTPTGPGKTLVGRVTQETSVTPEECLSRLENYHNELGQIQEIPSEPSAFPNLAWEALKLGLAKEEAVNEQLNREIDRIQEMQTNISLLLDLNAEISGSKEDAPLSAKAEALLMQLEARGVSLRKEGQSIEELKRKAGSKESSLRSEMQIVFTTKVQRLMQMVESMMQILQHIIRSNTKLMDTITRNTRPGG
ncbi:MAG: hypothetical protein KGQ49_01025 [Verrucomicrobia bacterium]|nr:hypothetical protein [Verrucomicrobiota bacterium]MBU6445964.1 hypothetical protein [Verrucomicrobiota bacterium]